VITVRPTQDREEVAQALALRHEVFVVEQGVPASVEIDARDADAVHLAAWDGARLVGTCRLVDDGAGTIRLGRMVVARDARRSGIASQLLEAATRAARDAGAQRIVLAAQTAATALYAADGYVPRGAPFMEAGIEHITMEKLLA
jgi:predicted GNAT family N-acyltransferase